VRHALGPEPLLRLLAEVVADELKDSALLKVLVVALGEVHSAHAAAPQLRLVEEEVVLTASRSRAVFLVTTRLPAVWRAASSACSLVYVPSAARGARGVDGGRRLIDVTGEKR